MRDTKKAYEEIYNLVVERLDEYREISDEELYKYIDECIMIYSKDHVLSLKNKKECRVDIFNSMKRFDALQELIEDDRITEIMINGNENVFIEKDGRITKWNKQFQSTEKLEDIVQRIAAQSNRIVTTSSPILDTRLYDGSRVNIVLQPIAINGPIITIRKFYKDPIDMEKLIAFNSISKEADEFLRKAVKAKYNIFISGGTGSGKTTFLNALSNYIPEDERVITIEDSAELQIKNVNNLVRLEARNANVEGENAISIRDLIKSSLRMRPDRIVVGEIRGSEAIDMLTAMNTGHDGSLSTGHANSPRDMMSRLETMILMGMDIPVSAIRKQIASAIDICVHLGRLRDKSRKVLKIVEITGIEDNEIRFNTLFEFKETGEEGGKVDGFLEKKNDLINTDKMRAAGL